MNERLVRMPRTTNEEQALYCITCERTQEQVPYMLYAGDVCICSLCVNTLGAALEERESRDSVQIKDEDLSPKTIYEKLNSYVIGQEEAKKVVATGAYQHFRRLDIGSELKANVLLVGPTGVGKTHIAKSLAKMLDVPIAFSNATALTAAGYVGENVEDILARLIAKANGDVSAAEKGIVFIDEIDKISRTGRSRMAYKDIGGEGVQQALLQLLEGNKILCPPKAGSIIGLPGQEGIEIDTSGILFICSGAFEGIEDIVAERTSGTRKLGFNICEETDNQSESRITTDDLVSYGLIPEFVGRLPMIAELHAHDQENLVRILTEPRGAVLIEHQTILAADGINLTWTQGALEEIAKLALKRGTGARGLISIVGELLEGLYWHAGELRRSKSDRKLEVKLDVHSVKHPEKLLEQLSR